MPLFKQSFLGGNTPLECHSGWITGRRPKSIAAKQRELTGTGYWNIGTAYYVTTLNTACFARGEGGVGIQQMFIREGSAPRSNPLPKESCRSLA